jgi:hypothetical protein
MNLASVQSHVTRALATLEAELSVLDRWTQAGFISKPDARRLYSTLGARLEALGRELQGKADCIASGRCDVCSCSFQPQFPELNSSGAQGCDTAWDPVRQEFRAGFGSKYDSLPLRMTKADELSAAWPHLDLSLTFEVCDQCLGFALDQGWVSLDQE